MSATRPMQYRSFEEFEREHIRPLNKIGFSLDDLEAEANFKPAREDQEQGEVEELNFG